MVKRVFVEIFELILLRGNSLGENNVFGNPHVLKTEFVL